MVHREHWTPRPDWLEWVIRVWDPASARVQRQHPGDSAQTEFHDAALAAFRRLEVSARQVKTWVSVQLPEDGEGYAEGYPHTHTPPDATTLVHYLDPGDRPAPLDIFDGEAVVETITPEPGLTVFFRNDVLHGARKNNGTKPRIQLIATALAR